MSKSISVPARKIVRRSTVRVVGYHASQKMCGLVPWESQIERDFFEWLETDPHVLEFRAQPETVRFQGHSYTPDAIVRTLASTYYAEVKPDKFLECTDDLARFCDMQRQFEELGHELRLVLEREIRQVPLRGNVKILMRHIRGRVDESLLGSVAEYLLRNDTVIRDLQELVGDGEVPPFLLRSIAQGYLAVDISQEIGPDTKIYLPTGR